MKTTSDNNEHLNIIDFNNVFFRRMQISTSYEGLVNNFRPMCHGKTFVVCDGIDSRYARRALYPPYKVKRDVNKKPQEIYDLMNKTKNDGLQRIGGVHKFEVFRLEADDLVAKLAINHVQSGGKCTIWSNDADFTQLLAHKGINLPEAKVPPACTPAEVRLYKTLVGDSSDNIGGLRLFGDKAWLNLQTWDRVKIEDALVAKDLSIVTSSSLDPKLIAKIEANWDTLLTFWSIIGFLDVPDDVVVKNMTYYPPVKPTILRM